MAEFVSEREWSSSTVPKNLVMALSVEAAELMEHFLWIDNDASRTEMRDPAKREQAADEIADVACLIFALCNAVGAGLERNGAAQDGQECLEVSRGEVPRALSGRRVAFPCRGGIVVRSRCRNWAILALGRPVRGARGIHAQALNEPPPRPLDAGGKNVIATTTCDRYRRL